MKLHTISVKKSVLREILDNNRNFIITELNELSRRNKKMTEKQMIKLKGKRVRFTFRETKYSIATEIVDCYKCGQHIDWSGDD